MYMYEGYNMTFITYKKKMMRKKDTKNKKEIYFLMVTKGVNENVRMKSDFLALNLVL